MDQPTSDKPSPNTSVSRWKARIEESRKVTKDLAEGDWKTNVDHRRGKPFKEDSAQDRVSVPTDWSMTKAKEAHLFSQVPTVILEPVHQKYKPVAAITQFELNDKLQKEVKVDVAMEESLADMINAAGVAGVKVGYLATFIDVEVPDQDVSDLPPEAMSMLETDKQLDIPEIPEQIDPMSGMPVSPHMPARSIKMVPAKKRVDCRFYANRISPSQLLWPKGFKGSDFDDAAWVGWSGSFTWAQALREFGETAERPKGLREEQKQKVVGQVAKDQSLNSDTEASRDDDNLMVSFTEVFYRAALEDPLETKLEKIRRIVLVDGIDEPVVDEDLEWQQWDEATESFVGIIKYPLRIGTLTYISDMAVPPSDSEVGRPQVEEKYRSRTQMILQRDRAQPMRWANVNRVDPMVLANMMRGEFQQIIPVNGDGSNAVGETARANYPKEDWQFDQVIDKDLMEAWQVGPNQQGGFNQSGRTAAEANIVQANFSTRQAKERGKVSKFFLGIAECVLGLMQLYYDGPKEAALIGPEAQQAMAPIWDRKAVSGAKFVFKLPKEDATVKLDSNQRLQQLERFVNLHGNSTFVNVKPVIEEIAALSGLDPSKVVVTPNPKQPEPPSASVNFKGEDIANPLTGAYVVAVLQKSQPVTPEDIAAAHELLKKSTDVTAPAPPVPQGPSPGAPTTPMPPEKWGPMERVTKRVEEMGG